MAKQYGFLDILNRVFDYAGAFFNVSVTGSLPQQITPLQSNAIAVGNGTPYTPTTAEELTFIITGTSTSRTIVFEMADPIKGVYIPWQCFRPSDNSFATQTSGGSDTTPETWQVDIPGGYTFRARISAVAGGDIDIAGQVVAG